MVIKCFNPFKSAESNGIMPALLQHGTEYFVSPLCHIFRTSLALGYIPVAWIQVKVVFIPKPEHANYAEAKAYCPISLSSFLLTTLEKIEDILGLGH
jgi:hypothetical protein